MDAVEVDRVGVARTVDERDPQPLALAAAQRRSGDPPVVRPRREPHAGRDLDLLVDGVELPLAQHATGREPRGRAPVEVPDDLVWVEAVRLIVDGATVAEARVAGLNGGRAVSMSCGGVSVSVPGVAMGHGRMQERRAAEDRDRTGEELAARERVHNQNYCMPKS